MGQFEFCPLIVTIHKIQTDLGIEGGAKLKSDGEILRNGIRSAKTALRNLRMLNAFRSSSE